MADNDRSQPVTSYEDAGGRPYVAPYQGGSQPRFRPGDKVYYINEQSGDQEGPYLIASLPEPGKCKLAHLDNGGMVSNQVFSIDALVGTT